MEHLTLGRTAALVSEFAVKDLPLGRTHDDNTKKVFLVLVCSRRTAYIVRDNAKTFTSVDLSYKNAILF